jgi:hypothetical protein
MLSSTLRSEEASLPMVLLAAIVLGGVVISLFTYVSVGQRTAREDRDSNQAIQVADAGIQSAFATLATADPADPSLPNIGSAVTIPGSVEEGTWTYTAERVGEVRYQVRSEGTFRDRTRVIEATIGPMSLFSFAAFADLELDFSGGNGADSYNVSVGNTGNGSVGSNNVISLRGNTFVDWVQRYSGATAPHITNGVTITRDPPIDSLDEQVYLPNEGAAAYADGGVCFGKNPIAYVGQFPLVKGKTYRFTKAEFPAGDHRLVGSSPTDPTVAPEDVRDDGPTRIYIAPGGNLELKGQGNNPCTGAACVNMAPEGQALPTSTQLSNGTARPDATALEIYLASGQVLANNHTNIAAGIYAPASNCSGPNAQGDLYGAIVCRTIDAKGGWKFHYDDRFSDVTTDDFSITGWREEFESSTSFSG